MICSYVAAPGHPQPSAQQALDALKIELRLRLALIEERERIVRERLRADQG